MRSWGNWSFSGPKKFSAATFRPFQPRSSMSEVRQASMPAWLAADGYEVHVVDLVPRHVERVVHDLGPLGVTAELGDARQLRQDDGSVDCVLLLGPLYHLTERSDRSQALREAARVVCPSGVIAGAAISRFASLFDGLARGYLFDPEIPGDRPTGSGGRPTPQPRQPGALVYNRLPPRSGRTERRADRRRTRARGAGRVGRHAPGGSASWRTVGIRRQTGSSSSTRPAPSNTSGGARKSAHLLAVARTPAERTR